MRLTPGQITALTTALQENEAVKMQFGEVELYDRLWEVIEKITPRQKSFIYALLLNKKMLKLRGLLIDLGLKPKQ